jgi:precorrin-8X/cobalt-precorrin-8 methylmutase
MNQPLLPQEIEQESFRRIEAAVGEHGLPAPEWAVVRRMIHASAEVELLSLVRFHPLAIAAGVAALRQGRSVFTDTRMLLAGISSRLHRRGIEAECLLDEPGSLALSKAWGLTRSAAAVELAAAKLPGSIVAIGNAPTSLRRLLALLDRGLAPPALIIGMPVGFVDAAESKEALLAISSPYITLVGPKGGSALAASALNALAILAEEGQPI